MLQSQSSSGRWQFWIDRGGTFTDIVALRPDGTIGTSKLLSDNPEQYADAAVEGIRRMLGLRANEPISPRQVECVRMGTTVATNALLERKGERTLLVTTRGLRDALRIGYQNRPRLFDLHIVLPELLYDRVLEADERITADGRVLQQLDEHALRVQLQQAFNDGFRSIAIVFMHGYRYPMHELTAERVAREVGFPQISVSHKTSPLIKFVSRGDTTVVDAYLSPILARYVQQVVSQMPGVPLYFMQSSGSLCKADSFQGKDAILSGPAGGIVGMARTAELAGFRRVVGFDMGGTSTDVSHYAGEFERSFETQVGGVRMRTPMMSIHTVAAGGGSVIRFDGGRLRVGPESAGANPGPACYRRGGPLTITDANVLLGKIQPAYFPAVFGPEGNQPLDAEVVRQEFARLADEIASATGVRSTPEEVAEGCIAIAVGAMANAIKRISVARGYDITRYVLQTFGGAGGQHACRVADALGIEEVFIHPLAGVLSAYGIGLADQGVMREASVELPLQDGLTAVAETLQRLESDARAEIVRQGADPERISVQRRVHIRYKGTDTALIVPYGGVDEMMAAFEASYRQRFAFVMENRELIAEAVSVEVTNPGATMVEKPMTECSKGHAPDAGHVRMYCDGQWRDARLVMRDSLRPGHQVSGPTVIVERNATTVVEPGWVAWVTPYDHLLLRRVQPRPKRRVMGTDADPVMLEVFNNLFMNIAEQMGLQLQNTAHSVNIKERLDFSCAVFDADGNLIANAPHIPVHLGSMSESIRTVITRNTDVRPGDVFVLNDAYNGGTHLPDVTVITPVFDRNGQELLFYVGSRGHHADIGGITPGSMPPFSRHITEEGVQIDNFKLVAEGRLREAEMRELLGLGPYPARNPEQNLADLRAQIAANEKGVQELRAMVDQFGLDVVRAYMRHVQDNAEEAVRRTITRLSDGEFVLPLDNGARICVKVRVDREQRGATIDFTGTSAQLDNNFNAPRAVTMAAVLFVFRTLVEDDIPLNSGCLKPLHVILPEGSMLNPRYPAAVVAGNVETSSCITNALYGALGLMGASQCTMNNFTFGNERYQYYETIAGGTGAGNGFDGTGAVQSTMTNSRLTDPEVLESRYPVLVESFEIRRGSGGAGRFRGGDGAVRRIRFLDEMTASILSNNRKLGPFGMAGGAPGAPGVNRVERSDGTVEVLDHIDTREMRPGDVFVVETPGGGGYGVAS